MNQQVLFIQGGGGEEDYAADARLVASLQQGLGETYQVHYPFLPEEEAPDLGRKKQIEQALSLFKGEVILVAHSLGASMLLKHLSESPVPQKITGLFLIATPFWQGDEDWKQAFKLPQDFAGKLPKGVPIFLYHCQDDPEVPIAHVELYAQHLPRAIIRKLPTGGHQLNNDLSLLAKDIQSV